jgi:carboxypeptidase C (cathepsin A)
MLVSAILQFQTAEFDPGNDLPYILFLPTYAATAWYHQKLEPKLQKDLAATLKEVEAFAQNEYALGLMKGSSLTVRERERLVNRLARYTGLSPAYIEGTDLRINIFRFTKELLRSSRQTVGRLDTRFKGVDRDSVGEFPEFDPSLNAIMGPYTAALNNYVRAELKFESDLPYEILTPRVQPWKYDEHENRYVNVAETLRKAFSLNPDLRVFIANGYFDLATPYFATQYTFNHLGVEASVHPKIVQHFYEAGHMMYVHQPSLARLSKDLVEFIRG